MTVSASATVPPGTFGVFEFGETGGPRGFRTKGLGPRLDNVERLRRNPLYFFQSGVSECR